MSNKTTIKLGDIAEIKGGKRLPKGNDVQNEITDHPYLRVVDFKEDGLDTTNVKYIDKETHQKVKNYTISSEDIYLSIAGTIGRVGIILEKLSGANLTENAAKITNINKEFNKKYLMYFLRGSLGQGQIQSRVGGTSQPKLALYKIKDIEIPKLSRPEQDKIVSTLSAYDDLIENNRRRIQLLEESARLLYREWFVHFRFPEHEHVEVVDGLPQGWEKVKVANYIGNVQSKKKIKKEAYLIEGEIPCVDQSREFIGGFTDDIEAKIDVPLPIIVFGDHTRILKFIDFPFARGADGTQLVIPKDDRLSAVFYYFALDSIDLSNYFYARHFKFLKDKEIFIPSKGLMDQFTKFAQNNMNQIKTLRNMNKQLVQARDILLPRLMSGEIAV
jgi:type I restriction enzyme S subunit